MPEPKRPLKVFLCHAHADRDAVRGLYTRLTKDGVDAWLDKEKLLPGQDWELEIRKAVREADVVVVCLSKQFNQAGFRQKEVRLALDTAMEKPEGEIFIIPARLEECDTLESVRKWHWVDLFEDDGYEMLMRALRRRADKIGVELFGPKDNKKETETKKLESIAIQYELKGDFWNARKTWYEVKRVDPLFPRVDVKIKELEEELRPKPTFVPRRSWSSTVAILFLLMIISIPLTYGIKAALPVFSETPVYIVTATLQPFPVVTGTSLSMPAEIIESRGIEMVLVSSGEFTMGSNIPEAEADERPYHRIYLDAYYIDKYEVTNAHYQACVNAGACLLPTNANSFTSPNYFGNPKFDNYPVIWVSWNMARNFCEWRGGRLPTEAEWEKAARGTDERKYPWGNNLASNYANVCDVNCSGQQADRGINDGFADTSPAGYFPLGVSPYGIYDMSGNVMEWVADFYDKSYYTWSSSENPIGPSEGIDKVLRGGSWHSYIKFNSTFHRGGGSPDYVAFDIGFRCVLAP